MSEPSKQRRSFDAVPLHQALGLTLEEQRPGFARVRLEAGPLTIGGVGGSIHGGVLAALVDVAMLQALTQMFRPPEEPMGTADLNLTFLRPVLTRSVFAEATVLRKGRQLAVTEVVILDGDGQLCAKGRTIYAMRGGREER